MARRRRKLGRPVNQKGRSKGEGQYCQLSYDFLHSAAWRSLSGAACKVFLELRTRFHGANNGRLILSLEEAAGLLGIGKATVQRSLEELQEKGLVIRTRRGQWYGRIASTWATTDKSINGDSAPQAWKAWRPPQAPQKTKRGSGMDPSANATGSGMDRGPSNGSVSEPVRPLRLVSIGSGMGR
jgi:biotin operon repressor